MFPLFKNWQSFAIRQLRFKKCQYPCVCEDCSNSTSRNMDWRI